jgi:hypothetical protein
MKAIGKSVPAIVFKSLVQKAEQELPANRFQKIVQSISEETLVA